jgi:hypothetical protein
MLDSGTNLLFYTVLLCIVCCACGACLVSTMSTMYPTLQIYPLGTTLTPSSASVCTMYPTLQISTGTSRGTLTPSSASVRPFNRSVFANQYLVMWMRCWGSRVLFKPKPTCGIFSQLIIRRTRIRSCSVSPDDCAQRATRIVRIQEI